MKNILSIIFTLTLSINAYCQLIFTEATDIEVVTDNSTYPDAFTGGYNSAQFCEIDLNLDGTMDLIIYDRFRGLVRPYINEGISDSISYTYSPDYAYKFPEMEDFLITRDYNNDGLMDLIVGTINMTIYENTSTSSSGLQFVNQGVIRTQINSNLISDLNPNRTNFPAIFDIDRDNDLDFLVNRGGRTIEYHRNLSIDNNNNYTPSLEKRSDCWGLFFESYNSDSTRTDSIYLDSCLFSKTGGERIGNLDKSLKHGGGLTISAIDYDNNSSTDILITDDGSYQMKMMLNADSVSFPFKTNSQIFKILDSFPKYDVPVHILFSNAFFIDLNNDGKKDLIAATNQPNIGVTPYATEEIWYYENVSSNNKHKFKLKTKELFKEKTLDFGRTSKPAFFDFNKDGLKDLIVGNGGYLDPNDSNTFIPRLALLENVGSKNLTKFSYLDDNYLDIANLDFGYSHSDFANASPCFGDIDGDGDEDMLLTVNEGKIFLFEDTSSNNSNAAFKFHPVQFQSIANSIFEYPMSSLLYDVNNDGILELIISGSTSYKGNQIHYFPNFGTKTNPIFNIPLDSLYWLNGDTMRYHFKERPNFSLFQIGNSVAVNNPGIPDNNPFVELIITKIDSANNFIECYNTIPGGVGGTQIDEFNSTAHLTFFDRRWNFDSSVNGFGVENIFLFQDEGKNNIITGGDNGENIYVPNFIDSLQPLDSITNVQTGIMPNFGLNSHITGTDLNNDSIIDLVIGTNTGGLKVVYGSRSTGIAENLFSNSKSENTFFKLYPNPAQSNLTIELNEAIDGSYEIYSLTGKLIMYGKLIHKKSSIALNNVTSGVYFVRVIQNGQISTQKLIIN